MLSRGPTRWTFCRARSSRPVFGDRATYDQTVKAAFFDLDKTVIAKTSLGALGPEFHARGLIRRWTLIRGIGKQLWFLWFGADEGKMTKIREQMQPGGIYGLIKPADRSRVETRLGDMQKLLQDHSSEGDMPRADKIRLTNAQEEVNGILRHNDNNRLVCERRAPLGSNIPVTTCRSYGEMETERRETQKSMIDLTRH